MTREEALKKVTTNRKNKRPVLALTFDPRLPDVQKVMSAAYKQASRNPVFKHTFPEKPMLAFRKQKTIGEHIIRAKLHPLPREGAKTRGPKVGFVRCQRFGGRGCLMCSYVTPTTTHTSGVTGEVFPITSLITCTTPNIIYDLWCDRCRNSATANPGSVHYAGKTKNTAAERFTGHRSDLQTGKHFKAVAHHFSQQGHKMSDMRFLPFEAIPSGDPMELASRESFSTEKKKLPVKAG